MVRLRREASQPSIVGLKPAIGNLIGSGLPLRVNRVGLLRLLALPLKTNDRTSSIGADDVRAGFDRWRCSALAAVLNAIGFAI